jgi:hypothetical protein
VFGGSFGWEEPLDEAEVYSIRDDTWTALPLLPFPVTTAFAATHNSSIYITGRYTNKIIQFSPGDESYLTLPITLTTSNDYKVLLSYDDSLICLESR